MKMYFISQVKYLLNYLIEQVEKKAKETINGHMATTENTIKSYTYIKFLSE